MSLELMIQKNETLVFLIEYDGTNYAGWQKQSNAISIQSKIAEALYHTFGKYYLIPAAGRTDAGVHARGQVAHCPKPSKLTIPEHKIPTAINTNLPEDIRIIAAKIVDIPFHATIDAIARRYTYHIHTKENVFIRKYSLHIHYKLDFEKLFESAKIFVGEWDLKPIAKRNPSTNSYVCRIEQSYWEKIDEDKYRYTIQANRFVYSAVRAIVGIMLNIARGKLEPNEVIKALTIGKRGFNLSIVPPHGLFLDKVFYPEGKNFF